MVKSSEMLSLITSDFSLLRYWFCDSLKHKRGTVLELGIGVFIPRGSSLQCASKTGTIEQDVAGVLLDERTGHGLL